MATPAVIAPKATLSAATEAALLAILDAPVRGNETVAVGFARKEVELRAAPAQWVIPARPSNRVDSGVPWRDQ